MVLDYILIGMLELQHEEHCYMGSPAIIIYDKE